MQISEFEMGPIRVSQVENKLYYQSKSKKIAPKVMEALCFLYRHSEQVVTRDELLSALWPDRFGSDESLSKVISDLRKSLSALLESDTKFVITVPKRGYKLQVSAFQRFNENPDVQNIKSEPSDLAESGRLQRAWSLYPKSYVFVASLIVLAVIAFWLNVNAETEKPPGTILVMPFNVFDVDDSESLALSNALLDETIDSLSNTPGISVASRMSSEFITTNHLSAVDVKKHLTIDYFVEGAIKRRGSEFEIRYRLVDAQSFLTLFSETTTTNELAVSKAVNAILKSLSGYFSIPVSVSIPTSMTAEVNRLILLGNSILKSSYDPEKWRQATNYLERAYSLAPNEPQVIRALGMNYLQMFEFADEEQRKTLLSKIEALVEHAEYLKLPSETLWFLVYKIAENDFDSGNRHSEDVLAILEKAHSHGERSYLVYFYLMTTLSSLHRYDEAIAYGIEGVSEHPLVYRLYAGLAYIYSLKRDGENAQRWLAKMSEIAPSANSTFWVKSIVDMVNGEHQFALNWRREMRISQGVGSTITNDILSLSATSQSQLMTGIWSLCDSRVTSGINCLQISLADAIQEKSPEQVVRLLSRMNASSFDDDVTASLIIQAIPLIQTSSMPDTVSRNLDAALMRYSDGRSAKRIPELAALVMQYLNQQQDVRHRSVVSKELLADILQDKRPDDFFIAEQAALDDDAGTVFESLGRIVESEKVPPVGRFYSFFDSPFLTKYENDERFIELKGRYQQAMDRRYQNLSWHY